MSFLRAGTICDYCFWVWIEILKYILLYFSFTKWKTEVFIVVFVHQCWNHTKLFSHKSFQFNFSFQKKSDTSILEWQWEKADGPYHWWNIHLTGENYEKSIKISGDCLKGIQQNRETLKKIYMSIITERFCCIWATTLSYLPFQLYSMCLWPRKWI